MIEEYPVKLAIDYPDRDLSRLTSALRIFTAIPILILIGSISGFSAYASGGSNVTIGATGLVVVPTLLMIVFRQRYPRWWFDWNVQLMRFSNRVGVYVALMDDRYPSSEDEQAVHLDIPYPDAALELNRWLPLVKWLLAIPHYLMLLLLYLCAIVVVIGAWFAILFTGRYPRGMFEFVEGVIRWQNRVVAYALVLATDRYPPFRLGP